MVILTNLLSEVWLFFQTVVNGWLGKSNQADMRKCIQLNFSDEILTYLRRAENGIVAWW
jgi:hypothetical protein